MPLQALPRMNSKISCYKNKLEFCAPIDTWPCKESAHLYLKMPDQLRGGECWRGLLLPYNLHAAAGRHWQGPDAFPPPHASQVNQCLASPQRECLWVCYAGQRMCQWMPLNGAWSLETLACRLLKSPSWFASASAHIVQRFVEGQLERALPQRHFVASPVDPVQEWNHTSRLLAPEICCAATSSKHRQTGSYWQRRDVRHTLIIQEVLFCLDLSSYIHFLFVCRFVKFLVLQYLGSVQSFRGLGLGGNCLVAPLCCSPKAYRQMLVSAFFYLVVMAKIIVASFFIDWY